MDDIFSGLREDLRTLLIPKQYFAWQTLLLLSLFSLFVAAAIDSLDGRDPIVVMILTNMCWIFFTSAIWWAMSETNPIEVNRFSLSPWITGIVMCLFIFRPWTPYRFRLALSSWPVISTGIKALPHFVNWELKFKVPKQKVQNTLITTLLVNLLLSSWIMFHFRIQDWVRNYPSLLINPIQDSAFVYDFVSDRSQSSQGVDLLENMTSDIERELNDQPWYQTERWLYTREARLKSISRDALDNLDAPKERLFWQIEIPEPRPFGEGYLLDIKAVWSGPVAPQTGFFLQKTCKIVPEDRPRSVQSEPDEPAPTSQVTSASCGEPAVEQWQTASN